MGMYINVYAYTCTYMHINVHACTYFLECYFFIPRGLQHDSDGEDHSSFKFRDRPKPSKDPSTGLTYIVLSGVRSQSVEDAERLFGEGVIAFMETKGYLFEAKYLRTIRKSQ